MGFWGYPFLWEGCFINWSEWDELPNIDLDVIFIIIEKDFIKYKIDDLRKKYPNAILVAALKETYNWNQEAARRIEVYNQCDKVIIPVRDLKYFPGLEQVKKEIHFLPQPVDIDYLYTHYYQEEREEKIFSYFPVHNSSRCGDTQKFTEYINAKYKIPYIRQHTQQSKKQWEDFLKIWTPCTFHFNLDPTVQFPGQQAMQCAALGVIHIGGVNDSHHFLWPDTSTNDVIKLEKMLMEYTQNIEKRIYAIKYAWKQLNEIYSYDAIRYKVDQILEDV